MELKSIRISIEQIGKGSTRIGQINELLSVRAGSEKC